MTGLELSSAAFGLWHTGVSWLRSLLFGWALGHAYAHAISEGGGAVCGDVWTCSIFADLASAVLVTVSAAPLVAALLRLASCGGGADATAAEESSGERDGAGGVLRRCVCSCARLLAGGLSTMTMVAWVEVRVRVRVSTKPDVGCDGPLCLVG